MVLLVLGALLLLVGNLNCSAKTNFSIKGVTIAGNLLVSVSSTRPKAYWALPRPDYAWDILKDLGINVIQVSGGTEGNVLQICLNPHLSTYDSQWAQNLERFLAKADSYGIKVVFHTMGNNLGANFGLVAPMHNGELVSPYTPLSEAMQMIDKLGGDNALHKNFIADNRILWWSPINEANIDEPEVEGWLLPILQKIKMCGGKTSVCVYTAQHEDYVSSFSAVVSRLDGLVDYFQVHEYHHEIVEAVSADASSDMYSPIRAAYANDFSTMVDSNVESDRLILTEFGCGSGSWQGLLGSTSQIETTEHQQADYIRAVFEAARSGGISKLFWLEPFDDLPDSNAFGFIRYDGTIVQEPYAVFKDGEVDVEDVYMVAKAYGSQPGLDNWNVMGDMNSDGQVDVIDYYFVCKNYGK